MGVPLSVEEIEDFLYFEELCTEVVIDDDESEDIAAVNKNDETIEQSHYGECPLKRSQTLILDRFCQVGKDTCEWLRKDASMRKVFRKVVRHIVILTMQIDPHTDLEGVDHCEARTSVGAFTL